MATGQTLLNQMELLNQELQLQTSEVDVTRGLIALNAAQDYFESIVARYPHLFGDTTGTVTTALNTETTAYPTGLLRVDRLQYLDANSRPAWDLDRLVRVGSHATSRFWPMNLTTTTGGGKPRAYWTNGRSIYWSPLPDGVSVVRWYGFQAAADITAGGTFLYPDECLLPFAAFATKLMEIGVGDGAGEVTSLVSALLIPVVDNLSRFNRDSAMPFEYRHSHNT